MAPRQRFIHPGVWKDPVFGRLDPLEQLLFIGFFSIADDEGRLLADPDFLKAEVFPYAKFTSRKVKLTRDGVVAKMASVHLYESLQIEYIELLKWRDYQKPKYPSPSKIPPAFPESSPNGSPELEPVDKTTSQRVGFGLGKGRVDALGLGAFACDVDESAGLAEKHQDSDWKCANCGGTTGFHFDRSLCACGSMHDYCDDCGWPLTGCDSVRDEVDQALRGAA
jgi:hypothetical protein